MNQVLKFQAFMTGATAVDAPVDPPPAEEYVIGNLPTKLKGVNLAPSFTGQTIGWKRMYDNWTNLWPIIKSNIDRAKSELGVNCIRLIGDPEQFYRATAIDSAYLTKYEQFIDYCASQELYAYATVSGWGDWAADGESYQVYPATEQQIINNMIIFCQMCNSHSNVPGIDLIQELSSWGLTFGTPRTESQNINFASASISQIKAAGVTKPLTFSVGPTDGWDGMFSNSFTASIGPIVDFLDFHVYYPLYDITDINPALVHSKPIIFGEIAVAREGGAGQGWDGQRNASINALQDHITNENVHGFMFWCMAEDEDYPGTHPVDWRFPWGLFDNEGTPYNADDVADFLDIPIPAT